MKYIFLSDKFYNEFPRELFPEIMRKDVRPYVMVKLTINGYEVGLPLRSNIEHQYAYWTNKADRCGIDYSKAVIIPDSSYINPRKPFIRDDEHKALLGKEYEIRKGFMRYLKDYHKALKSLDIPRNLKLVNYSTLQYFHKQLMIEFPKITVKEHIIKLYSKEFPTIRYISEDTAKLLDLLNKNRDIPFTVKEILQSYKDVGKRLEHGQNKSDLQEFKLLQKVVDDLKNTQLIDKQYQAHQKITEQQIAITKDPSL